jgi:hypothetical protein
MDVVGTCECDSGSGVWNGVLVVALVLFLLGDLGLSSFSVYSAVGRAGKGA